MRGAGPSRNPAEGSSMRGAGPSRTPAEGSPRVFRPGDGAPPPTLAGRDAQQCVLLRCLSDLAGGAAPPHNVVLTGPRGNGKTALLNWFQGACRESATPVDAVVLTPHDAPSFETLVDTLAPRRGLRRLLPRKLAIASVGSAEWSHADSAPRNLTRELIVRCRKRPLAALVDEAHTLPLDMGGALLNASQRARAEAPFLLVLAGTPGLPAHLDAMDASFWPRLGEGNLGVGLLDETAAAEALGEPLTAHDVSVEADALCSVLQHSQHYPYFIQLWGDALWKRHLATNTTTLTSADTDAVRPAVAMLVAEYYQDRYRELETAGLQSAAKAVALVFQNSATAGDRDLDAALADADLDDATARIAARNALNRLGYIWCPPSQTPPIVWTPGIPSLMAYVLERAL